MREKTIKLWQEKTDWIAQNGGMVLVNVHPDYINFDSNKENPVEEFSIKYYIQFLEHIRSTYKDKFINVLPGEVSNHLKNINY